MELLKQQRKEIEELKKFIKVSGTGNEEAAKQENEEPKKAKVSGIGNLEVRLFAVVIAFKVLTLFLGA